MFDIGFWEILIIAVVLLLVMGPERLPEAAKQAAWLVRKGRQTLFKLRSDMQQEMSGSSLDELDKARQEMQDLKQDIKQFGKDLADEHESINSVDIAAEKDASHD